MVFLFCLYNTHLFAVFSLAWVNLTLFNTSGPLGRPNDIYLEPIWGMKVTRAAWI